MEKKFATNEPKEGFSDSDDPQIEPNLNHIQREQAIKDSENYSEIIDGKLSVFYGVFIDF
jgi:hypothetical protein